MCICCCCQHVFFCHPHTLNFFVENYLLWIWSKGTRPSPSQRAGVLAKSGQSSTYFFHDICISSKVTKMLKISWFICFSGGNLNRLFLLQDPLFSSISLRPQSVLHQFLFYVSRACITEISVIVLLSILPPFQVPNPQIIFVCSNHYQQSASFLVLYKDYWGHVKRNKTLHCLQIQLFWGNLVSQE